MKTNKKSFTRISTQWMVSVVLLMLGSVLDRAHAGPPLQGRLVFAHYHMAHPVYSNDIAGYSRDIKDAQSLGIDGFVVNVPSWTQVTYFKDRVGKMFAAAKQLNSGFRLFLSADMCCGLPAADIRDMVATYASHPNYFKYNNRPVLTTFVGQGAGQDFWQNQVLGPLRASGQNVFFVPFFATANGDFFDPAAATFNNPSYQQIAADYLGWWKDVVDGLSYFAVCRLPRDIKSSSEAYAALIQQFGKTYLAGTSPYFWIGRIHPTYPGNQIGRASCRERVLI